MKELCAKWKRLGHRLGFGVGISLGYAAVGMVGSAGRFDYTASGTSVNTAARLCDMAADDEVLISPRVWVAVEGDFQAESWGEVEMKGIREPVEGLCRHQSGVIRGGLIAPSAYQAQPSWLSAWPSFQIFVI